MNKIPLLDMKAQIAPLRKEINEAMARVIDKGGFILGEEVKCLEEDICKYTNAKYAIGVSNGTDAITLALEGMNIGKGDKVICPSFTYYATAGAVARLGAEVVFVDIDPKTYCIDVKSIEAYFKRNTHNAIRNTKAIIPVHLYGQCADMDAISKLAEEYDLKVIEDTAQAFGASYKSRKAGTIGDCGTVSFFPGKNLGAFGDAGMVLTNNKAVGDKIRRLRNQGADPSNKYKHEYLGHNNRLDALQAAILGVKLKSLDRWNSKRAENAAYYNEKLKGTDLMTPFAQEGNIHIYHQYVLRAKDTRKRDAAIDRLQAKGIDSRVYYPIPLHLQECFSSSGYKIGDLPESEKASKETFAIPV
ncbi:MAG: DegT/DnrJ/EryC1/StrS family aminotransferase, partial [Candidatus Omnitrophota bacterium]